MRLSILFLFTSISLFPCVILAGEDWQYERIKVFGKSLDGNLSGDDPNRDVSIYLPPSYNKSDSKRYPVLYLLHGYFGSDAYWYGLEGEKFIHTPRALDTAWEEGAMEMIVVTPNGDNRFSGSMYSNSVTVGDWETFIAEELVTYVDSHYRTLAKRESRGLAGHSMGGYGALRIGMKSPQVFSALYAMSPCCMAPAMNPDFNLLAQLETVITDEAVAKTSFGSRSMLASAAAWSPNANKPPFYLDLPVQKGVIQPDIIAKWAANAPLTLVHQYVPALRSFESIFIDAGNEDVAINQAVYQLSAILTGYGINHAAEEYKGDHINRVHERLEKHVMPMMSQYLSSE